MKFRACSRRWQVEAVRDGRLAGKDLETAMLHREHCAECAAQERHFASLTHSFSNLPALPRDPLTVRRSRQRLLSARNDSLLAPAPKRPLRWAFALALVPAAALGYAFLLPHATRRTAPPRALSKSAVEVHAPAGARWLVRSETAWERVELSDGQASLRVHPHPGRRVLVIVPDGEIEDMGTTFDVTVHAHRTSQIAVSEGRVAVRLSGEPEFFLRAGERWERSAVASSPPLAPAETPAARPLQPRTTHGAAPRVLPVAQRTADPRPAQPSSTASATANSVPLDADSTRAEDAAYLAIVALLREGRTAEARAEAKGYLLRFPSGFRRVEVLNVATSTDGDSPAP